MSCIQCRAVRNVPLGEAPVQACTRPNMPTGCGGSPGTAGDGGNPGQSMPEAPLAMLIMSLSVHLVKEGRVLR